MLYGSIVLIIPLNSNKNIFLRMSWQKENDQEKEI
jgi:hypothetical protein